jgi:hypothetical protein
MRTRGVCYDVGRVLMGQDWRPMLDVHEMRRELEVIGDDLHCNAVRICGQDVDRLVTAGEYALDLGLEVWLSPELWDNSPEDTLDYVAEAAKRAEELRTHRPGQVVFSVGSELTLFMRGMLEGDTFLERLQHPSFGEQVRSGAHNAPLDAFLAKANDAVRQVFKGDVTYASVPLEAVDWSRFDVVAVDLYRDARIKDRFSDLLRRFFTHGRPVVVTEFGCCTYRGADDAGVDGTFVFTFVAPTSPHSDDPRYDLDMASYSLVTSYPDMPWEPKTVLPGGRGLLCRPGTARIAAWRGSGRLIGS